MKAIKKISVIVLALAVFAGTLVYESGFKVSGLGLARAYVEIIPSEGGIQLVREGKTIELKEGMEIVAGDIAETPAGQTAEIRFSGNGVIRVGSGSKVIFVLQDTENDGFSFKLEKGRIWVNNAFSPANVNVLAGGALLIPRKAIFDVSLDETKTVVKVTANQVGVGLVKPGFIMKQVIRFNAAIFINSYLVAQGGQTTVYLEKLTSIPEASLRKLLYSKLIKEFPYVLYDKKVAADDPWFTWNNERDVELSRKVASDRLKMVNDRGLKVAEMDSLGFQMQIAVGGFSDVLTFSREKIISRLIDGIFNQLFDAEYLLIFERSTEAKQRLDIFRQMFNEEVARQNAEFKQVVMGRLRTEYANLAYVFPGDKLFEVKSVLSDVLREQLGESKDDIAEKFGLVRDYINYAYHLADSNVVTIARTSLEQYFTRLVALIEKEKAKPGDIENLVAEENQIVDNLFRQYPIFYQDQFFAWKYKLEGSWLGLLPDGPAKTEEKQSMIISKMDFLKQLQVFFLDNKVTYDDARKIANRLIEIEINELKVGSESGVNDLFESRLAANTKFLYFILSIKAGNLKGTTMREKYDSYLESVKDTNLTVQEAIEGAGNEPLVGPDAVPLDDPVAEPAEVQSPVDTLSGSSEFTVAAVKEDFAAAGITGLQLGDFTGAGQRLIFVDSAVFDGIVFRGIYDLENKLISEVRSGTSTISAEAVSLNSLVPLLKLKQLESTIVTQQAVETQQPVFTQPVVTTQQTIESQQSPPLSKNAERAIKLTLIQKLKKNGIVAAEAGITVTDSVTGLFEVKNASVTGNDDIKLNFNFNGKENVASGIVVTSSLGMNLITEEVVLTELSTKVLEGESFYNR